MALSITSEIKLYEQIIIHQEAMLGVWYFTESWKLWIQFCLKYLITGKSLISFTCENGEMRLLLPHVAVLLSFGVEGLQYMYEKKACLVGCGSSSLGFASTIWLLFRCLNMGGTLLKKFLQF